MAAIYKYAILTGIPDPQRGERVNVGIAVFRGDGLDIRFPGIAKMGALSAGPWTAYVVELRERMDAVYRPGDGAETFINNFVALEKIIQFSDVAWFSADADDVYEARVRELIDLFVRKPPKESAPKTSRINTEMAAAFRSANVLASVDETIDDHKVVQDFYVSKEELLKADFVHKNGVYHVTATLDLRGKPHIKSTTYKGMVLVKTRERWADARRYAVYAAAPGEDSPHLRLMRDYANETFNWLVPKERRAYKELILDSLSAGSSLS